MKVIQEIENIIIRDYIEENNMLEPYSLSAPDGIILKASNYALLQKVFPDINIHLVYNKEYFCLVKYDHENIVNHYRIIKCFIHDDLHKRTVMEKKFVRDIYTNFKHSHPEINVSPSIFWTTITGDEIFSQKEWDIIVAIAKQFVLE